MTSLWLDRAGPAALRDDPLPERTDVLVIGAGVTGLVTALELARGGRRVAVAEARTIGAVTTGRTTSKISLLQATKLSRIRRHHSASVVRDYVAANRRGMDWLLAYAEDAGVSVQRPEAITFAATEQQVGTAREEERVAREAGLPVRWDTWAGPIENHGAVVLEDQAQCDPVELLRALGRDLIAAGGSIHEGRRLTSVSLTGTPKATFGDGSRVEAEHVVLATGTPVLDRSLHFARLSPQRSYLLAYTGIEGIEAMAISAGRPTLSLRAVPGGVTLVGGAGHTVGRTRSERAGLDDLRGRVLQTFPEAVETHAWSAQDYSPFDELPVADPLPGNARIQVATGFDKWGMTNGPAAGLRIADALLGRPCAAWARDLIPGGRSLLKAVGMNLEVSGFLVGDWARLAGDGVCTHLGGRLHANDAEGSRDCPLHGSRFAADGTVLEGPATRPCAARQSRLG